MNNTPIANRKTIVLAGKRNSGKSSLFNLILGQDMSIVSDYAGTTTDPVGRNMELIGYGPVRIIDTAGLDDLGDLGQMRVKKTQLEIGEADLIVHVFNAGYDSLEDIGDYKRSIGQASDCLFTSIGQDNQALKDRLSRFIADNIGRLEEDRSLLDGLAKPGDTVVLVVPIDSEAPKGRLILPQVQMVRACLDEAIISIVVKDTELEAALDKIQSIDLVVTDSKVFDKVAQILDESGRNIDLTSFSIVFARQKGDIGVFLEGAAYLDSLKDGDRVLIAESCTHTTSHEDIGTVLIPNLIRKKTGKDLDFEFSQGKLDETDLSRFALMIQCGGCMMTRNNMMNRIGLAGQSGIPITNYGVVLAYLKGVFDRAIY